MTHRRPSARRPDKIERSKGRRPNWQSIARMSLVLLELWISVRSSTLPHPPPDPAPPPALFHEV